MMCSMSLLAVGSTLSAQQIILIDAIMILGILYITVRINLIRRKREQERENQNRDRLVIARERAREIQAQIEAEKSATGYDEKSEKQLADQKKNGLK